MTKNFEDMIKELNDKMQKFKQLINSIVQMYEKQLRDKDKEIKRLKKGL